MAKYKRNVPVKHENYKYKSRFGSHADMIDEERTSELNDEKLVVLHDEHGYYITERTRLDNGLMDSKRSDGRRMFTQQKNRS
jgi:hypothetical protein